VLSPIDASPVGQDSKSGSSHHEPRTPVTPVQPISPSIKDAHAMLPVGSTGKSTPPAPSTPHRRSFSVAPTLSVRVPPAPLTNGLVGASHDGVHNGVGPAGLSLDRDSTGMDAETPSKRVSARSGSPLPPPLHPFGASLLNGAKPKPTSYYSQSKYIPSNEPTSPHGALEMPAPPTVFLSDGSVLLPQAESDAIASALSSQATTPRTRIGGGLVGLHLPGHSSIPSSIAPMRPGLESRLSIHRRRATLDTAASSRPDGAEKVAQFEHDLALARRKVGETQLSSTRNLMRQRDDEPPVSQSTVITVSSTPTNEDKLASDMTFVSAAAASKSPNTFAEFFSLPIKELLHPIDDERSWLQRLTHSFLPVHPSLEEEYHLFFRARSLQLNRRAVFSVIVVIFALSFYEQVNDLEATTTSARGLWSCHFVAFVFGLAWLWVASYRKEWYIRHLNIMTLLILCLQSIMFITVALFRDSLGTAYGTGMCLLLLSVISMASSMNFVYSVLASLIILAYYPIASLVWKGTVPGIILMLLAGTFFYVRAAWDSSYNLREIFLRKRNQVAETNLSMQLLDNMLPPHILHLMRLSEFIALAHVEADILFSDIVGFTALASLSQPIDLVAILNVMFSSFDREALEHGVYKVETIGDAYLACCGVVSHPVDHTRSLVNCGLGFQRITQKFRTGTDQRPLVIRVGIHTGPVVSGVIGKKMPRYHLFGETVTIAETMEQKGTPGRVAISEATRANLEKLGCLNEYELEALTSVTLYVHANDAPTGSGAPSNRHLSGKPQSEFSETPRSRRREKIQVEMKRYLIQHLPSEQTAREIANTMLPVSNTA
jgi:class 3 adenylate cyclase